MANARNAGNLMKVFYLLQAAQAANLLQRLTKKSWIFRRLMRLTMIIGIRGYYAAMNPASASSAAIASARNAGNL
jgi:hypothetical protein